MGSIGLFGLPDSGVERILEQERLNAWFEGQVVSGLPAPITRRDCEAQARLLAAMYGGDSSEDYDRRFGYRS